jgi:uncharacterized RDD family membrane protein YckC
MGAAPLGGCAPAGGSGPVGGIHPACPPDADAGVSDGEEGSRGAGSLPPGYHVGVPISPPGLDILSGLQIGVLRMALESTDHPPDCGKIPNVQDEILLGEGVAIDARPASFATRLLASLIDVAVLLVVALIIGWLFSAIAAFSDAAAQQALDVVLLVLIIVVVPVTVETLSRGRSLGKLALGIRIVRDDAGPIRIRHAVIRALVGVFELWMTGGSVALISSLVHPKGKRLGDMVAGTYALRVRGGQKALPPIFMPPELAGWAHSADIRRLPDGLALQCRQVLGRVDRLHLNSRVHLGGRLAAEMEQYVAPGPPLGTHPERFIAAVLAERRDREYARAQKGLRTAAAEGRLLRRLPHAVPDPFD